MNTSEFYKKYRNEHYCCPKCHSKCYESTLVAYILDEKHPELYKDRNTIDCCVCGWKGIYHQLIPKPVEIGYKIAFTDYEGLVKPYDNKIYPKNKANYIVTQLNDEKKQRNERGGTYIYYEVDLNI